MSSSAKTSFFIGLVFLSLSIINASLSNEISQGFLRAEVIASLSSICLIVVSYVWTNVIVDKSSKVNLIGKQGFEYRKSINTDIAKELAWGSQMILTATPAITILVYWDNQTILRRGILGTEIFSPGSICKDTLDKNILINLANTKLYPDSSEFDSILENLPSIVIYPIKNKGWVIVGGSSQRCFNKSDERWIVGWGDKLSELFNNTNFEVD